MVFKGRLAWSTSDAYRVLDVPKNLSHQMDTCCYNAVWHELLHLREYYFDSAITVNDTFYVGGSQYSNIKYNEDRQTDASYLYDTLTNYFYATAELRVSSSTAMRGKNCADFQYMYDFSSRANHFGELSMCYFPYLQYMRCDDTGTISHPEGNYSWVCDTLLGSIMIYPIIEVDTTQPPIYLCDPVQNLEASIDTAGCLNITWDDFLLYSYCEVQYYSMREGYGSNHTETVYGNRLTVCDLDTSAQWCVRVRAFCDTSKILTDWTPWLIAGRDMPSAVDGPSSLASFTSVAPNPATKTATVTSCFGMRGVEVYNMRGILVYVGGAPYYTSTEIDLQGWAPGQYIVIIETPAGKTAKRLTVVK